MNIPVNPGISGNEAIKSTRSLMPIYALLVFLTMFGSLSGILAISAWFHRVTISGWEPYLVWASIVSFLTSVSFSWDRAQFSPVFGPGVGRESLYLLQLLPIAFGIYLPSHDSRNGVGMCVFIVFVFSFGASLALLRFYPKSIPGLLGLCVWGMVVMLSMVQALGRVMEWIS